MEEENYYEILNISKNSSQEEIKKQYRILALKYHPDKNGDSEMFKKINKAYQILSDPEKKMEYDRNDIQIDSSLLSNLFSNINSTVKQKDYKPKKMNNVIKQIEIPHIKTLSNSIITKTVLITKFCLFCKIKCSICDGIGYTNKIIKNEWFQSIHPEDCKNCNSSGKIVKLNETCSFCFGKGNKKIKKEIQLEIPKNTKTGDQIISEGNGIQPYNEQDIPGDLIFNIEVIKNKNFLEKEGNIYIKINISFLESIIGKVIKISLSDNDEIEIDIRGWCVISPLKNYILKNKGVNGGDLILRFIIEYPKYQLNNKNKNEIKNIFEKIKYRKLDV